MLFSSDWVKVEGHEGYSEMDLQIFLSVIMYNVHVPVFQSNQLINIQSVGFWFYQNTYKSSPYLPCETHLHKTQTKFIDQKGLY